MVTSKRYRSGDDMSPLQVPSSELLPWIFLNTSNKRLMVCYGKVWNDVKKYENESVKLVFNPYEAFKKT